MTTEQIKRKAFVLVHTSVEDCRISLHFVDSADVVREALRIAEEFGQKTRISILRAKIRKEGW